MIFGNGAIGSFELDLDRSILTEAYNEAKNMIGRAYGDLNTLSVLTMESADVTTLNEASSNIKKNVIGAIDRFINFIVSLFRKIITYIDTEFRSTKTLIKKYRNDINNLTDADLTDIVYDKIEYNLDPAIPIPIRLDIVNDAINNIQSMSVTREVVKNFDKEAKHNLNMIRARIMGLKGPVYPENFEDRLKTLFKKSDEYTVTPMRKDDLIRIVDSLELYKTTEASIKSTYTNVISSLNSYKAQLSKLYSMEYNSSKNTDVRMKVRMGNREEIMKDIEAIYYIEYQKLVTSFVMQVIDIYTRIFDTKLKVLKEKMGRDSIILKQTIRIIQEKKGEKGVKL